MALPLPQHKNFFKLFSRCILGGATLFAYLYHIGRAIALHKNNTLTTMQEPRANFCTFSRSSLQFPSGFSDNAYTGSASPESRTRSAGFRGPSPSRHNMRLITKAVWTPPPYGVGSGAVLHTRRHPVASGWISQERNRFFSSFSIFPYFISFPFILFYFFLFLHATDYYLNPYLNP